MDGLEWKRSKYSKPVQQFLKFAERLAVKSSDFLISDSLGIQKYIDSKYNVSSTYIAYGAKVFKNPNEEILKELGYSSALIRELHDSKIVGSESISRNSERLES
jgi:hypothetical protein